MPDDTITVRFAVRDGTGESDLTVAELGALMTGLSRSLNKLYVHVAPPAAQPSGTSRDARYYEPVVVKLTISALRKGSVTLDGAIRVLSDHGAIIDVAKTIGLNILASALYDQYGKRILLYDFRRAVKRVSKGALGKTFELGIRFCDRAVSLRASVSKEGKVQSGSDHFPEDDVQ